MGKSLLVTASVCLSLLVAAGAQQQNPSNQPAAQPAPTETPATQTPATVPVVPASTCPAAPVAPILTSAVNPGTIEIKGTAMVPPAGCGSQIQVQSSMGTVLAVAAGSSPAINSDGTFSFKLQNALTDGQIIGITQTFVSMDGSAAPVAHSPFVAMTALTAPAPAPVQAKPAIAGTLREGSNAISGTISKLPATVAGAAAGITCSALVEVHDISGTGQLLQMSGGAARGAVGTDNTFSLTLQESFRGGQKIRVDEIFQNCEGPATLSSDVIDVVVPGDWGRVKSYFTSGILLSQDQNSFSQSSLFMGFNLDKTLRMPGYYHQNSEKHIKEKEAAKATNQASILKASINGSSSEADKKKAVDAQKKADQAVERAGNADDKKRMGRWPGINTFFDVRLTSIPVSACNLPNSTSGVSTQSSCAAPSSTSTPGATPTPTPASTPSPTPALDTFLSQRKTARLAVGIYFPWTITSWVYNKTPNAFFIAPLAKIGFDTPAGDLTQIQTSTTNSTTTNSVTAVNPASFYNFHGYGGRLGHYALTSSRNEAPELISYLDVIFGPYSNLESLMTPEAGSANPPFRKRLYRLAFEGVLKVPSTPIIIGFSANVGQEAVGKGPNNIVQRAGDDLRFLLGVRFDAAKLMSVITKVAP